MKLDGAMQSKTTCGKETNWIVNTAIRKFYIIIT